ncbi:MAG: cation diffusion facilitator family transporter [Candidatus Omnitrophica bacterium]|nr:cation diffusion facilitator family transporter [Candidatus Omnitrophota bacterium]MDD5672460.1 cation diffusion facilitator family transporter [Candidatus Omnitrophota bacterium]
MKGSKQVAMFKAAQISLFGNIVLFTVKLTALLLVHSLAIATDLGITVVGLIVSVIFYYSVKVSNRPADLAHNYGYGKIEHVCEALEGIVLIGIALVMSVQAVLHLAHTSEITMPWLGFGFSIISVIVNFLGSAWILSMAKICASPAVRAEGIHYRLEGFISLTIAGAFLLAILLAPTFLRPWTMYLDPVATLIVSIWITVPSFEMSRHAFLKLLDASLEEGSKMEVIKQLGKYMGQCCEFRDIRSRSSGRKKFVECDVVLPCRMSFPEAHRISSEIEKDLRNNIPGCEATARIIPCDESCAILAASQKCPYLPSKE